MKNSLKISSKDFKGPLNIPLTMESGQTSQPPWLEKDGFFQELIMVKNKPCLLKISSECEDLEGDLEVEVESPMKIEHKDIKKIIMEIFGLKDNLDKLYQFLRKDPKLEPTIDFCRGLRLFKAQDPFECLISSISSANNSVIRWNRSIRLMKMKWGDEYLFSSGKFYTFPRPQKILQIPEHEIEELELCGGEKDLQECINNLQACGVGYRGKYMKKAAQIVSQEINLSDIFKINYDKAFELLLKIPGVGPKVADCVLLYGFGKGQSFPVDVWIKRIIEHLYFSGKELKPQEVRLFGMEQFGDYAGYVQLYLFHYARKSGLLEFISKKKEKVKNYN